MPFGALQGQPALKQVVDDGARQEPEQLQFEQHAPHPSPSLQPLEAPRGLHDAQLPLLQ